MATANFKRMEHFPLYARDDIREGYCPRCDCWHALDGDAETCPECGATLQGISVNDYANAELVDAVTQRLDGLAADLTFWRVSVCSGYYGGVQLYAESIHDDPEDLRRYWSNDDCRAEFDMCKSQTIRACEREQRKVCRAFKKIAREFNFACLETVGTASSGETFYRVASPAPAHA